MGNRRHPFTTLALAAGLAPAIAWAEVPAAAEPEPPPPAAPETAEPSPRAPSVALTPIEARVARDAAADRTFLTHTALVSPARSVTFDLRAPLYPGALAGARGSLTGRIELGLSVVAAASTRHRSFDPVYGGHLKVQLVRTRRAAVAAAAGIYGGFTYGAADGDVIYQPSLVANLCTDDDCSVLVGAHVDAVLFGGADHRYVFPGVSVAVGRRRQFLAEIHAGGEHDVAESEHERDVIGGFVGARFPGAQLTVDLGIGFGVARGLHGSIGAPYPFIGIASRT